MENILKRLNSKWFLLFLFMFLSISNAQAQWDEDTDGDGVLDWVESIWDASPAGKNSSWEFEDGQVTGAHFTTMEELLDDYSSYASNYGSGGFGTQVGMVFNANGTIASSYSAVTKAMIGGSYFNGVNANGVTRVYVGNIGYITNEVLGIPGVTNMNNLTLIGIYDYILPSGEVITGSGDYIPDSQISTVSVIIKSEVTVAAPPPPTYTLPCNKLAKANLADLVYGTENGVQKKGVLPSNVTIVPPSSLPDNIRNQIVFTNPSTGFNSALYRVDKGNGNIEYVYATAGTDNLPDWTTNYQQAFSKATEQYQQSRNNAVVISAWVSSIGGYLSFTGHSLGGGLANVNALATGLKAIVFNPAGLSQGTVDDPNLDLNMSDIDNVTAYVVKGEPVDILNSVLGTPKTANKIEIGDTGINSGAFGYKSHLMSAVKAFLDCNVID